jgi:hypothetical protein
MCCTCRVKYFIEGEVEFETATLDGVALLDTEFALETWLLLCNQFELVSDFPARRFAFDLSYIAEQEPEFCWRNVGLDNFDELCVCIQKHRDYSDLEDEEGMLVDVETVELRLQGLFDAARVQLESAGTWSDSDY